MSKYDCGAQQRRLHAIDHLVLVSEYDFLQFAFKIPYKIVLKSFGGPGVSRKLSRVKSVPSGLAITAKDSNCDPGNNFIFQFAFRNRY